MAVVGVHGLVYTSEPEEVRTVFCDVLGREHADAGEPRHATAIPSAT